MALTAGAGPHSATITIDGASFLVENGTVDQHSTRKTSSFSVAIPLSSPGAEALVAGLGENTTTIDVTSRGNSSTLFTGESDTVEFDYIGRTIRITGRDKSAKLHEKKTNEKWQNKKGSEIVSDLAGRAGLSVNADGSPLMAGKKLEQDFIRLSDNVSFGYVIHKMAQFDGARWWVDAKGVLQYKIGSENPGGIYTVNYVPATVGFMAGDFLALRVRRNIQAGKNIKVKIKSWHPKEKKVHEYESNVEGKSGTVEHSYHIPNLLKDHVRQYAKSRADDYARHELTIHAQVVGDPAINVAMGLQLSGTKYWDQVYAMDTVHHQFGMGGHLTSITARSAKSGRSAS